MVLVQLVLGPLAIGVLAGVRLDELGPWGAASAGYATFACAQLLAAAWLLVLDRPR